MRYLFRILVAVALTATLSMAEVVSYSATSKVSQKDADQAAMNGLAKQLRSKVSSEFAVTTKDDGSGKVSKSVYSRSSVSTNIVIQGAKITQGKPENGVFQSTASVETTQMASKILLDLSAIRSKMKSVDSLIRLDMLDRDYRKMATDMVSLEKLADEYNMNLENLSCVQTVPADLKLESTLGELSEFLVANMSSLKMETDVTSEALMVTITDFAGPVNFFPVALTQDNKDLAHEKTNEEGEAVFPLTQVRKKKPTGEVTVHADLNFKYIRQANFITETVSYSSDKSQCSYQVACDGPDAACMALQKYLNDMGIPTLDKADLPKMDAKLVFTTKANSGKTLYTTRVTATLQSGKTQMTETAQGVGRDEAQSQEKAIQKLPATKIFDIFGKSCKK